MAQSSAFPLRRRPAGQRRRDPAPVGPACSATARAASATTSRRVDRRRGRGRPGGHGRLRARRRAGGSLVPEILDMHQRRDGGDPAHRRTPRWWSTSRTSASAPASRKGLPQWATRCRRRNPPRTVADLSSGSSVRAPPLRVRRRQRRASRRSIRPPSRSPTAGRALRILFLADVFGRPGRDAVRPCSPELREQLDLGLVVANGENVASGARHHRPPGRPPAGRGRGRITLGNHTWRQRDIAEYLIAGAARRPAGQLPGRRPRGGA